MIVDKVTDNGDNSISIIGHDDNGSYETAAGRKSDLPKSDEGKMNYYLDKLNACLPPETEVLYQNPDYTPPAEEDPTQTEE